MTCRLTVPGSRNDAIRLRKLFEFVGRRVDLVIDVTLTDGSQPVGNGVGPVLEARDVMQVLRGETGAPSDLRENALALAGRILEFDPDLPGGEGYGRARRLLDDGAALAAMKQIISAQGPAPETNELGPLTHGVTARREGVIAAIDCQRIARIARLACAPMDKGAGLDLFHKVGGKVAEGDALYRIHAHFKADFKFATDFAGEDDGYLLS